MEVKFSALKGHIDCKIPIVNSKVNPFIDSLKETKNKIEKPKNNNIEVLKVTEGAPSKKQFNKFHDGNSDSDLRGYQ